MTNTTLKDLLLESSLWGAIADVEPFPFIVDETPEMMDLIMGHLYGERELLPSSLNVTVEQLAKIIVATHKPRWLQLIDIADQDWDTGGGATRRMTETITETENRTTANDDVNKIATFDDELMTDTDAKQSTGVDEFTNEKTRTVRDGQYSLATAYTDLQTLDKTAIINAVIKDVAIFTTLSIY